MPIIQTTSQTIKNLKDITKQTNNETTSHASIHPMQKLPQILHRRNPTQSRKKNLQTQTINQNKLRSKCAFLPHVIAQTHVQFFPSHSNQTNTLHKHRRLLESAVIFKTNHTKQRQGFYQISPNLANIILNENKIKIENGLGKFFFTVPPYF